jgi:hypothetical protein
MAVFPGVRGFGKVNGVLPAIIAAKLRCDWTASTLTTTLPGVGRGVGAVVSCRGFPTSWQLRAFIVSGRSWAMVRRIKVLCKVIEFGFFS